RSTGRAAGRAVESVAATATIEKTRRALRQRVLPVSCWDWPEAVHSTWPQRTRLPIMLRISRARGPSNSTAFRVVRGFRAEALSLSHLTWDTTWTINLHIFGSTSFPV